MRSRARRRDRIGMMLGIGIGIGIRMIHHPPKKGNTTEVRIIDPI
jgi:hypothetical protein